MLTFVLIWFVAALIVGLLIWPRIAFAAPERICRAPVTDVIYWRDGADGIPQPGNLKLIGALERLSGPHFGYKRGDYVGMDIPADWHLEAVFSLLPGRQWIWFMNSPSTPGKIWVYRFPNDPVYTVHTPITGDHWGIHPCDDMVITRAQADAVYAEVKQ